MEKTGVIRLRTVCSISTATEVQMKTTEAATDLHNELAQLQAESLKLIAVLALVIGYAWLLWSMPSRFDEPAPLSAWIGIVLLIPGTVVSLWLKDRRLHIAAHLLVWSTLGAVTCAVLTFPSPATVHLFIVPVLFASVLLSQPAFLLVAAAAGFVILSMDLMHMGVPLLSGDRPFPLQTIALLIQSLAGGTALSLAIIALATLSSWLSARSLYTALGWFYHAYERARHNEQAARNHQAELKRVLKALDEASHRLERVNYMLRLTRDQAEEAQRLKQQFAQTISHELRTPLNLIVGFAELMTQSPEYYGGRLSAAYQRDLNIVHRNACHLQSLVNDVLDLARIEAAQMSILPEEIDPASLVQEAVNTARSLVEAGGLTLHTQIEADLPSLWGDPTRIRQVLFNLLNNAARFTEQGSVTISVWRQEEKVCFAVADTGLGIAAEDIPRIFDEFQQIDGGTRRRHGGAGLGLAISRQFVELHNGHIWVESQPGKGSTFYFSLPLSGPELAIVPGGRKPWQADHSWPARESEEPVLLVVTRSLSAMALLTRYVSGFRTVAVPDLEQARHSIGQLVPQMVVIDKACEDLSRSQLEEMARMWELPGTPFITCSLPGEDPLRQQLAVEGYLIKPVSRQNLWDVLRQFGEHVDKVLVVDDDQDFVLLLSRLLEDSPVRRYHVVSASTGREGLAMIRHYHPDLVLLDLMLPDMDGIEVIKQVRSRAAWQHIPIVVVSAQDETDHQVSVTGPMMIAKAGGLKTGELVQWIQSLIDSTTHVGAPSQVANTSA
jgi:signal transduction histidine kinase/CheY-like chemotaxis protein